MNEGQNCSSAVVKATKRILGSHISTYMLILDVLELSVGYDGLNAHNPVSSHIYRAKHEP